MKTKLLALVLLAGSAAVAAPRVFAGVGFGASVYGPPVAAYGPMPVAPAAAYVPPMPGPGYAWVGGYWSPAGARWGWHAGNWARRPYAGAYWAGPRWYSGRYYSGHWRR
jgi:hypothetical protein